MPTIRPAAARRRGAGIVPAAVTVLVLLAGCGSGGGPLRDGPPAPSGPTRTVEHDLGTVEVPVDPQRVVVSHPIIDLDPVVAVGIDPVGGPAFDDRVFDVPSYLDEQVGDGYRTTGSVSDPDLEAVAALRPDVIVAAANNVADVYDELSRIAPVIAYEYSQPRWKEYLQDVGSALGRAEEARQALAGYEDRVAEVAGAAGSPSGTSVSVMRVRPDALRAIQAGSFSGSVLADVGFARPEGQQADDEPFREVSPERVGELDADLLFLWGAIEGADEQLAALEGSPLWRQMDVVARGAVVPVREEHWFVGGPLAAQRILDDVAAAVAPGA